MTAARDVGLTLAGGGNRAFHQIGVLQRWGERLLPRLRVVAACSAGACVITTFLSGRAASTNEFWKRRREGVTRNLDFTRLLRGERPAPHAHVYRDTVIHSMQEGGLERVRAQPFPILVLTAAFPRLLPTIPAVVLGLSAYNLEKRVAPERVHPTLGRRLGFVPAVFDARECESPEEMADLVLASSATPPFTPVGRFRGKRLLDGGMVDNAPAFLVDEHAEVARHLVLLTRPYPEGVSGLRGGRWYLTPSRPTPIERWDYTRPERLDETIALGEADAEARAADFDAWLDGA